MIEKTEAELEGEIASLQAQLKMVRGGYEPIADAAGKLAPGDSVELIVTQVVIVDGDYSVVYAGGAMLDAGTMVKVIKAGEHKRKPSEPNRNGGAAFEYQRD